MNYYYHWRVGSFFSTCNSWGKEDQSKTLNIDNIEIIFKTIDLFHLFVYNENIFIY